MRSPRSTSLLLSLVLGTVLTVLAPLAPLTSATAAAPARVVVATVTTDPIVGWATAPTSVYVGSVYSARVRVPGGSRPVHLQRYYSSAWHTVTTSWSSSTGLVQLRWTAPRTATRVTLRVLAPRTGSRATAVTPAKSVTVRSLLGTVSTVLSSLLTNVLGLVNDVRASGYSCGGVSYPAAAPLRANAKLNAAASKYARSMATHDFFSHTSPGGSTPVARIEAEGYRWRAWGENIAGGQRTASDVVQGWLASSGHCKNIMNRNFTEIGLGYAEDLDSTYDRYWVQDFGRPM